MLRKAIDSMLILLRFDERKDYYNSISPNWLWNSTFVDNSFPINTTTPTTTTTTTTNTHISSINCNMSRDNLITTPLLSDSKELSYRNNNYKLNRAKSIPNRNSIMNYNKRSKRNEKRNKRKNQFNHIRLHSYDESIKADLNDNSYYEDGEFGTDITYLPLSEFNNSMDQLKISNKTIVSNTTTTTTTTMTMTMTSTTTLTTTSTNTTTNSTNTYNKNTESSRLTVDEEARKDHFNSSSLPILLHPPSQIAHQKLETSSTIQLPSLSSLSSSSPSSTSPSLSSSSPSGSVKQITNPNLLINNHSNLILTDDVDKNKMNNFHLLIDFHKRLNKQNKQTLKNDPFHDQQELALTTTQTNWTLLFPNVKITENNHKHDHNHNHLFNECITDCIKLNDSQKGTYRTPVTHTSGNNDVILINNENLQNNPIATTTTTTISSLINNYSLQKPYTSNIHFNTSRSNSGQTLMDQNIEPKNDYHHRSKLNRLKKSIKRKHRSHSFIYQQSMKSISSSSSSSSSPSPSSLSLSLSSSSNLCFINSLNHWSKYQYRKHWSFTFYDFENEQNLNEDDTALVHSVFAVVAARQRKKHNGSKGFIKKVSEYDKLGQTHYDDNNNNNNRNIHENKSKSHQTSKQIHQHIKLASYTSNDLTNQPKYKQMNNNDEQQSWHLCIKWNPNHLSNQSTFNSININDQNKTLSNETTHQLKLKKTHILATLGTEIDKTSLWNNNNSIDSLISANIHGLDQIDQDHKRLKQQQNYTQNHFLSQSKDHINRKSIICSICQHLIDHNSKDPILPYLDNNQFAITDQTIDDQKLKEKYKLHKNSNNFYHHHNHHHHHHSLHYHNHIKYKRNSYSILPNHHRDDDDDDDDPRQVINDDCCSRQISKNIDHTHNYDHDHDHDRDRDQCKYRSKIMMNSLDQTNSTTMLHCQQCLFKMNKGYMNQRYLNGQCNNNNNTVNGNSTSTMLCCSHCNQWFIPLWNQVHYYSRNKRNISKDDNLRHRSYNHHYYHRSSSQPQTKHERIIQNHLSKNHRFNHNDEYRTSLEQTFMNNNTTNNNIQCSNIQHRIQFNQQSCKRQSKHRHKRTRRRAKSYLPIHRLISNDINNQINDSSAKSNHYKLDSYRSQKELDHQTMMKKNDKFIVDPSLDLSQRLIHLKQDHKFKRYNRKYLGQLNVQEWLNKTLTNNY